MRGTAESNSAQAIRPPCGAGIADGVQIPSLQTLAYRMAARLLNQGGFDTDPDMRSIHTKSASHPAASLQARNVDL